MAESNVPSGPAPIEMLAEWEGPAIHNPTLFAGPKELEGFIADARIGEAATWVASTGGSPFVSADEHPELKAKVVDFLTAWRQRHGPAKLDELKQQVFRRFERGKADPAATRRRVDALFAEAGS